MTTPAHGNFMNTVGGLLSDHRQQEVLRLLRADWPAEKLVAFLASPDDAVVEVAVVCLGLVGSMEQSRYVALLLRRESAAIIEAAEQSLWQIWMRSGSQWGVGTLRQAIDRMQAGKLEEAFDLLRILTEAEPEYAEPHHQRGLVLALLNRYGQALPAYHQALRLNPYHFAAAEGLGQIYLERGLLRRAYEYYQHALHVHPHLETAREIADGLKIAIGEMPKPN